MSWKRASSVLSLVALVGCGSEIVVEPELAALPSTAAPEIEGCAAPLLVPQGPAWVGKMRWHNGTLEPSACNDTSTGAIKLMVPGFFLDQDEVTNDCYLRCVEAGACLPPLPVPPDPGDEPWPPWDDASMRRVPTRPLDAARADAFCAWRGGRVPTLAELIRAEHGSAVAVVNEALTALWLACGDDPTLPECDTIWGHVYTWPSPVRDWPLDQGPFGHWDLAGSATELTSSRLATTHQDLDARCEMFDTDDPGSFGSGPLAGYTTAGNLLTPPTEGETVGWVVAGSVDGSGVKGGVRCAYDPL